MLQNSELGPDCPVCLSTKWRFTDMDQFTGKRGREPQPRVTTRARCENCSSEFDLDLKLDEDSRFRKYKIKTVSPPQGFGWGDPPSVSYTEPILHVWGNTNDSAGTQYVEQYHLQEITVVKDNS